ncbi:MAG: hypothetical protein V7751_09815 [Pseudoalteromonas distincta]
MNTILVYDLNSSGHRASYLSLTCRLLGGQPLIGSIYKTFFKLMKADGLIFTTCDGRMLDFFLISILRAALGKKTAGIAIRPEVCLDTTRKKLKIKAILFKTLKKLEKVKTLSILPFTIESRLESLVDDWILDPQYWDLNKSKINSSIPPTQINELVDIQASKDNRLIIASLGKQVKSKGSDYLCNLVINNPKLSEKYIVVLAGKCDGIDQCLLEQFEKAGGVLVNRYLSDDELESSYQLVDLIWCCYTPEYNQSSGIFGRAIQNNKNTIVRASSYLEEMQNKLYYNGIALTLNNETNDANILLGYLGDELIGLSSSLEIEKQEGRFVEIFKNFFFSNHVG